MGLNAKTQQFEYTLTLTDVNIHVSQQTNGLGAGGGIKNKTPH